LKNTHKGSEKILRTKDWAYTVQISLHCFSPGENGLQDGYLLKAWKATTAMPAWNHAGWDVPI